MSYSNYLQFAVYGERVAIKTFVTTLRKSESLGRELAAYGSSASSTRSCARKVNDE